MTTAMTTGGEDRVGTISLAAIEMFVSPRVAQLQNPAIISLAGEFPEAKHWVGNFILTRIFHGLEYDQLGLVFATLRRAEAAFEEWELGCAALGELREGTRVSAYFTALRRLENAISAVEQAFQFGRKALAKTFFLKGDGSSYQRLNFIYNEFRHHDATKLPKDDPHGSWITDDGFHVDGASLTFDELADLMRELFRIANAISSGKRSASS